MGVCNCSMFFCMLLYVHSSFAVILIGKSELVALLNLSCWCLVMVVQHSLAVPWVCLRFVIVVFPDHAHYFLHTIWGKMYMADQDVQCFIIQDNPRCIRYGSLVFQHHSWYLM